MDDNTQAYHQHMQGSSYYDYVVELLNIKHEHKYIRVITEPGR